MGVMLSVKPNNMNKAIEYLETMQTDSALNLVAEYKNLRNNYRSGYAIHVFTFDNHNKLFSARVCEYYMMYREDKLPSVYEVTIREYGHKNQIGVYVVDGENWNEVLTKLKSLL